MAREQRKDVDYFPHDCHHSRELQIIETKFGNDGYAVWFKLKEELGKAQNHFIDISDEMNFLFLVNTLKVEEAKANLILESMAKLKVINPRLFEKKRIIFSEIFCNSVAEVYRKRKTEMIQSAEVWRVSAGETPQSAPETTQSAESIHKEKKSKEKERKEKDVNTKSSFFPPTQKQVLEYFISKMDESGWMASDCDFQAHKFVNFYESKDWMIGGNKMAKWKNAAAGWIQRDIQDRKPKPAPTESRSGVAGAMEFANVEMRED